MTTVFIISAPSGSGKSTLVSRLLASDPRLRFSVSYTTRRPRGNEKPGESYIYISRQEFLERIAGQEFLEHAEVFGNFYGTHREVLEQAQGEGKDLILDIDVQGAGQLKDSIPDDVDASTYRFIIVAAKRARQLQSGQRSVLPAANKKPTMLSMEEVRRGLVPYTDLTKEEAQPPVEE